MPDLGALMRQAPLASLRAHSFDRHSMAVRLRLTRVGGKKDPIWRVVVADQRSPRDGRVIEIVGQYNAQTEPVDDQASTRSASATGSPRAPSRPTGPQAPAHAGHRPSRAMAGARLRELLEYLARALVDEPDAVAVEQFEEDDGTVVLELVRRPRTTTARSSAAAAAPPTRCAPS